MEWLNIRTVILNQFYVFKPNPIFHLSYSMSCECYFQMKVRYVNKIYSFHRSSCDKIIITIKTGEAEKRLILRLYSV